MKSVRVLIWFHRDLRTQDHAGLNFALAQKSDIFAIAFSPSSDCSSAKINFWKETATHLELNLKSAGIQLEVSHNSPIIRIPEFVKTHKIDKIITHRRMNHRDQMELTALARELSIELLEVGDLTLFRSEQVAELSLAKLRPFTQFKNYVTQNWEVPPLEKLSLTDGQDPGEERVRDYIWSTRAALHYHLTRNGMIARDDSSKFSKWLSLGAVSPRMIYYELKKLESEVGPSEGITALIYELIWRDYFKFLAHLMKESFFSLQGLRSTPLILEENPDLFESWTKGQTGQDFVDANMRELLLTGWMSNRGRQNVASYLAKTLHLDWTLGARWFEQNLVDEDPENNWGNWQYLAGVGTDPRDRRFDVVKQAVMYDPDGSYQELWLGKTE